MTASILIVDDHEIFCFGLATQVERYLGFRVLPCIRDGKETIEFFENGNRADLLVLDLELPKVSGFAVLEYLRKSKTKVRKLVLTSHANVFTASKCRNLGAHGLLDKLNPIKKILATI